jgi:hypothetical protein
VNSIRSCGVRTDTGPVPASGLVSPRTQVAPDAAEHVGSSRRGAPKSGGGDQLVWGAGGSGCNRLMRLPSVSWKLPYSPTPGISCGGPATVPPACSTAFEGGLHVLDCDYDRRELRGRVARLHNEPPLIAPGVVGRLPTVSVVVTTV